MLNVLIVDDEALVRTGIRHSVPWANYQMQVAAEAASVFREQRADGADVRELPVQQRAVAFLAIGDVVARLDGVLLGDEAVEAVRQHAAVFGVFEVHIPFSLPDQRPRIILEMMFFWISLEPPKIDSLR